MPNNLISNFFTSYSYKVLKYLNIIVNYLNLKSFNF